MTSGSTNREPGPRPDEVTAAQVFEALVFAPIGLGARLVSEAPDRLRQIRSDLTAARFLGEMAVTQGAAQLRSRAADARRAAEPSVENDSPDTSGRSMPGDAGSAVNGSASDTRGSESTERVDESTVDGESADDEAIDPSMLAIPDYDTVPAIDVVSQLADLDADERDVVERYERANRGRRTVLGKIDQLRGTP
ncbi:MAG: hypothetical protein AAFP84_13865 [Actinomycetota bacterium]